MRVLVQRGSAEAGKRVSFEQSELHHLRVRRPKVNERVEVLDGAGLVASGTLVQVGREWMVDIGEAEVRARPAALTLVVAAGDRDRFFWMVEKAVELGVTGIVPVKTANTSGVATGLKSSHLARLRRSALEALKQSGLSWAPSIEDPVSLEEFLEKPPPGVGWLADQQGKPVPGVLGTQPVTVVIGPEGGFTGGERESVLAAHFEPVALGYHTLRFETAALAAAAVVTQARMRGDHG
jgi:16S rRNA (uracil1498-N3)-methyltransferase